MANKMIFALLMIGISMSSRINRAIPCEYDALLSKGYQNYIRDLAKSADRSQFDLIENNSIPFIPSNFNSMNYYETFLF